MTEPNGHVCPECTAPRTPDGTPSCACTQRASDALRDARTAEAAAAEDFDPLRIRPYVELGAEDSEGSGGAGASMGAGGSGGAGARMGDEAPMGAEGSEGAGASMGAEAPVGAEGSEGAGASMGAEAPVDDGGESAPTVRLAALPSAPQGADVHPFEKQPPEPGPPTLTDERPRRRRRAAVLGIAGAVVTVVTAAGIASGLFAYDTPARDGALPEDVRASVPDVSPDPASGSPSATGPSTAAVPAAPAPSRSASASASTPPSSASASPSRSAAPTQTQPHSPTANPTESATPSRGGSDKRRVQTLRRGDEGPEVTELQLRLRQLVLYTGDDDGRYDSQVEDAVRRYQWARGITADELGVYGGATRASLEAETTEP
ncbi:peptidoglycan-binding protein [Streptomyces sp. NPDC058246]|uniref:peptidoglycan-binding domain-containing protein n=1 Tax=Streptomyces sp. NPDC058246 TaxID=3346400 RepID=UPI0036EFA429